MSRQALRILVAAAAISTLGSASASAQTTVANGGTGRTSLNAGGVVFGNGTSPVGTAVGASGQVLQSNGAAAPTWITATNANTASTVVKRDASGNFSAGTVTATLNGRASTATSLAANGGNCGAGQFAKGVDASGNAECAAETAEADPQVGAIVTNGVPRFNGSSLVTGSISDTGAQVTMTGIVNMPNQSFVAVSRANTSTNMSFADSNGAGTGSAIDFDTEQVDTRGEFNPSTDTFTAQTAGAYMVCSSVFLHPFTPWPVGQLGFDVTAMSVFDVTNGTTVRFIDVVTTSDASGNSSFQYHLGGCVSLNLAAGQAIQVRIARPNSTTSITGLLPLTANSSIWLTIDKLK